MFIYAIFNSFIISAMQVQTRQMSGHGPRLMNIKPSRFQWNKFKDLLHFYTLVGAIPVCLIILCTNVFVGPATLTPVPEGYQPNHWEYFKVILNKYCGKAPIHFGIEKSNFSFTISASDFSLDGPAYL